MDEDTYPRRFWFQFCLKLIDFKLSQDPAMRKILLPAP